MFFAIIFIAIGVALLLNALGFFTGSFWTIFWGIVFLAIGIKMLRREKCVICGWGNWRGKIHEKMHSHFQDTNNERREDKRKQK